MNAKFVMFYCTTFAGKMASLMHEIFQLFLVSIFHFNNKKVSDEETDDEL